MRVLVVDESPERAELLREGLVQAGHEVTASLSSPVALLKTIDQVAPDVIVIDTDSPSRDVLEHLVVMRQHTPRPVVMFASDATPETIQAVVRAGVSAYVVDGLSKERIKSIIDVAVARFEDFQRLKVVERAKGILMKTRGLDEAGAYALLRKSAMDRKLKLAEVAQLVIDAPQ